MAKSLILAVWFLAAAITLSCCLDMVSAANTVENCVGLILLVATVVISVKTKCFTKILKIWRKQSKS